LSCHDQGEYTCYVRQSCALIATSKDVVAFPFAVAFAAHVLKPLSPKSDVYEQKVVTYVGTRVYPSSVPLHEGRR